MSQKSPKPRPKNKPLIPAPGWSELEPFVTERRRLGFSLGDAAAAIGCDYSRLSLIEGGRTPVSVAFVERYRHALERLKDARAKFLAAQGGAR